MSCHDITEILLKVAINTITITLKFDFHNLNVIEEQNLTEAKWR